VINPAGGAPAYVVAGIAGRPAVVTGLLIELVPDGHSRAVICGACGSFVVAADHRVVSPDVAQGVSNELVEPTAWTGRDRPIALCYSCRHYLLPVLCSTGILLEFYRCL